MVSALADLPAWRRELVIAFGEVARHWPAEPGRRREAHVQRNEVGRAAEVARRSASSVEGTRAQLAGASCRSA